MVKMGEGKIEGSGKMDVQPEKRSRAIYRGIMNLFRTYRDEDSDVPPPVAYDRCTREIRPLQAIQHFSDGAKFEFQSVISPRFSTAHSFSWGSQHQPPSYMLSAAYAGKKFFMNGILDDQGSLQLQGDYNWFQKVNKDDPSDAKASAAGQNVQPAHPVALSQSYVGTVTRLRAQLHKLPSKSIVQLEQDLYGKNFVLSLKASNHNMFQTMLPMRKVSDIFSPSGSYSVSFMQRLTGSLSVGIECSHQRLNDALKENLVSYAVRYAKYPKEQYPQPPAFLNTVPSPFPLVNLKEPDRSFVAVFSPSIGILYSSFYQRLSQRLEAFADLNIPTVKPQNEAQAQQLASNMSLGIKLDTLNSTIRTMVDSSYTVTTSVEERLFPGFSVQISARTNYGKDNANVGHVGFAFALESQ